MSVSPLAGSPPQSGPPALRPVARWRWWIHVVLLGSYVLAIGWIGLNRGGNAGPALPRGLQGLLIVVGFELGVFGIVFALAWLASRASRDDLLLRWRGGFLTLPTGIGYSVLLRLAVVPALIIICAVLIGSGTKLESLEEVLQAHQPKPERILNISAMRSDPVYFVLMVTLISFVVAGLREELWRAGFLAGLRVLGPRQFASLRGQLAAAAIAAVIFGLAHLAMGWLAALMAGVVGFSLGMIMVLHRSIWPAVIAHGTFDATTFVFLRWIDV